MTIFDKTKAVEGMAVDQKPSYEGAKDPQSFKRLIFGHIYFVKSLHAKRLQEIMSVHGIYLSEWGPPFQVSDSYSPNGNCKDISSSNVM